MPLIHLSFITTLSIILKAISIQNPARVKGNHKLVTPLLPLICHQAQCRNGHAFKKRDYMQYVETVMCAQIDASIN